MDQDLRDKMARRWLIEVLGLPEATDFQIRQLDHIPYNILIRPLVMIDSIHQSQRALATRFQISRGTVQRIWNREKELA